MMGLIKDRHGTYYAQRRVPDRLQEAVARVLKSDKPRQVFLKRSLGTKVLKDANTRAKPVLMEFDRTLSAAEALLKRPTQPKPLRTSLNDAEIKRMAEYVYAKALAWDERTRYGRDELRRIEAEHERLEGPLSGPWAFPYETLPEHGLSPAQLADQRQQLGEELTDMRECLALGDISAVEDHIEEALSAFDIRLDRQSGAYPRLGIEVLRAYVRALQAIEQRNAGEPVPTPQLVTPSTAAASGTLKEAFEGWKKERERPEGTVHEYGRAIDMFIQLHGNLPILEIKRSHARTFREALQLVPKSRKGTLLKASLPELSDYGRVHPTVQKVSPGTVNKQLGAAQAVAGWGRHNGLVPEDAFWSDPFEEMRLDEEQSQREPFDARDLQTIFNAPLFTEHKLPVGAKGDAGIWLPLLALFAGARQAEYAGLRVSDIREDSETRVPLMWFTRDTKAGRRLKTKSSERVVPVHPQLVKIGFLNYVAERRKDGEQAWLFPTVAPDQKGALRAWAKWWGRHLRDHVGVKDTNKVFHSFRHGFQDALRQATPDEELRDALAGRSSGKSVSRRYGAKAMLERWGVKALKSAIDKINYPGLDLSRIRTSGPAKRTRGTKANR
ncbi:site-specific integrase [Bradyrhizobium sp. AUGA SZCCT0283]|uniref:site-specific integrase n=1 Tax=Bradyrhizobium sp. AUGA SZCCT0283 TaxID=2807671 RepID=UPI001BA7454F|nr:site-specific integrase [Bradyrhizobium sp. AUGA SZCCT0283]MBR1276535.1 site-specific integrase [Bradyrhizobium sp. AUGA SZCCT0283]